MTLCMKLVIIYEYKYRRFRQIVYIKNKIFYSFFAYLK